MNRSIGSGYGYGYGYDGQMSDPQGMPLTGNAPWGWGTTGHAANRHCPLEPAPAPVIPGLPWLFVFFPAPQGARGGRPRGRGLAWGTTWGRARPPRGLFGEMGLGRGGVDRA